MRGKLQFIAGGLVGYVLGARAGRKRYEQIAATAKDFWNAPPVQRRVHEARDAVLDLIGDAPVALFHAGRKAVKSLTGSGSTSKKSPRLPATYPGDSADSEDAGSR